MVLPEYIFNLAEARKIDNDENDGQNGFGLHGLGVEARLSTIYC
jgi:hypothetical protein